MAPGEVIVLGPDDYRVLGAAEFGAEGLVVIESVGPFVDIQATGPLLTVHDSTIKAHKGIGHHPHRYNERLFYMLAGSLDHDDRLNGIRGHMGEGDVGRLTEGRRGMVHSEWNRGDIAAHAFILELTAGMTLLVPPAPDERSSSVEALELSRVLRVVHGPGFGLLRR